MPALHAALDSAESGSPVWGRGNTVCVAYLRYKMVITPQHKLRVMHLYRHSLKHLMSWAIRRNVFASEVCCMLLFRLKCTDVTLTYAYPA